MLVADRRGDVLLAQGKAGEARAAYLAAWKAMDEKVEYRRLIDAKLTARWVPRRALAPRPRGPHSERRRAARKRSRQRETRPAFMPRSSARASLEPRRTAPLGRRAAGSGGGMKPASRHAGGWAAVLLALVVLAGCASDKPKPKPLEPVTAKISGRQVWSAKLASVQFPLAVVARECRFVVAGAAMAR